MIRNLERLPEYLLILAISLPFRAQTSIVNDDISCGLSGGYIASMWLECPAGRGNLGGNDAERGNEVLVLTPIYEVCSLSCQQDAINFFSDDRFVLYGILWVSQNGIVKELNSMISIGNASQFRAEE